MSRAQVESLTGSGNRRVPTRHRDLQHADLEADEQGDDGGAEPANAEVVLRGRGGRRVESPLRLSRRRPGRTTRRWRKCCLRSIILRRREAAAACGAIASRPTSLGPRPSALQTSGPARPSPMFFPFRRTHWPGWPTTSTSTTPTDAGSRTMWAHCWSGSRFGASFPASSPCPCPTAATACCSFTTPARRGSLPAPPQRARPRGLFLLRRGADAGEDSRLCRTAGPRGGRGNRARDACGLDRRENCGLRGQSLSGARPSRRGRGQIRPLRSGTCRRFREFAERCTIPRVKSQSTEPQGRAPMRDEDKSKEQLISELADLRRPLAEVRGVETECRRAEEWLAESNEEPFRAVFEEGPIGLVLVDPAGRVQRVNRRFLRDAWPLGERDRRTRSGRPHSSRRLEKGLSVRFAASGAAKFRIIGWRSVTCARTAGNCGPN